MPKRVIDGKGAEKEMNLTLRQSVDIHAAAEDIAQFCSSVPEAQKLSEEARAMLHAAALLASMKMAERMLVILK